MKYFYINGDITHNTVENILDFFNKLKDDDVTILLNSDGGYIAQSFMIYKLLKEESEKRIINMILGGEINSAASVLAFSKISGYKELLIGTRCIIHKIYYDLNTNDISNSLNMYRIKLLEESNAELFRFYCSLNSNIKLNKEEWDRGENIYIDSDDLLICLDKSTKEFLNVGVLNLKMQ